MKTVFLDFEQPVAELEGRIVPMRLHERMFVPHHDIGTKPAKN